MSLMIKMAGAASTSGTSIIGDYYTINSDNVNINSDITSPQIIISNVSGSVPVAFTNDIESMSINGGTFVSSGTISNGQTLVLKVRSQNSFSTNYRIGFTVGSQTGTYTISTRSADLTPDIFTFSTTFYAIPNTQYFTSSVLVTGLEPNYPITISATNGTIDAGTSQLTESFTTSKIITTSSTGTLVVSARGTSNVNNNNPTNVTVHIGTMVGTYTIMTNTIDNMPDPMNFVTVQNSELNFTQISNTVTITGLEPNYPVDLSSPNGLFDAGTTVLSGTFKTKATVTTSASGTLVAALKGTSSSNFSNFNSVGLIVGLGAGLWTIFTRDADIIPAPFSFTDMTNANPNTSIISNTVTLTGLEPNYSFTITTNNQISNFIDAGTSSLSGLFESAKVVTTSATGTLVVALKLTSANWGTSNWSDLIINDVVRSRWTVTSRIPDVNGVVSVFTNITNALTYTDYDSNMVTVSGLEPNYVFDVGTYCSNSTMMIDAGTSSLSGTFSTTKTITTSATGTFVAAIRLQSDVNSIYSISYNVLLSLRDVSGYTNGWNNNLLGSNNLWIISVLSQDVTPAIFNFNDVTVSPFTITTSNTLTITDLSPNSSINVSATNGTIDAGTTSLSGTFSTLKTITTSATGTLVVAARGTSVAFGGATLVNVTIGNLSDSWIITSRLADFTPTYFSIASVNNAEISTYYTSETVTVYGLEKNYSITVSSGDCLSDAGTSSLSGQFGNSKTIMTSADGTIVVALKGASSPNFNAGVVLHVTVGDTTEDWRIFTRILKLIPNTLIATPITNALYGINYTTSTYTITGLEPNFLIAARHTSLSSSPRSFPAAH